MQHFATDDDATSYQPRIFDPACDDDMAALSVLTDGTAHITVYNTLESQVAELIKSLHPRQTLDATAFAKAQREHIGHADLVRYGRWVFFPWSRRLVRTLAPADHFFLRSNRNQHKITA